MSNLIKRPQVKEKYDNYINGKWTAPSTGQYFEVVSPVDGKLFSKAAHSAKLDVEMAVDAATVAFASWSQTSWQVEDICFLSFQPSWRTCSCPFRDQGWSCPWSCPSSLGIRQTFWALRISCWLQSAF